MFFGERWEGGVPEGETFLSDSLKSASFMKKYAAELESDLVYNSFISIKICKFCVIWFERWWGEGGDGGEKCYRKNRSNQLPSQSSAP